MTEESQKTKKEFKQLLKEQPIITIWVFVFFIIMWISLIGAVINLFCLNWLNVGYFILAFFGSIILMYIGRFFKKKNK